MCLGIPGKIIAIDDESTMTAVVEIGTIQRKVNVACVAPSAEPLSSLISQWVLVHVGFAMSIINEEEANKTLDILQQWSSLDEELELAKGEGL